MAIWKAGDFARQRLLSPFVQLGGVIDGFNCEGLTVLLMGLPYDLHATS